MPMKMAKKNMKTKEMLRFKIAQNEDINMKNKR